MSREYPLGFQLRNVQQAEQLYDRIQVRAEAVKTITGQTSQATAQATAQSRALAAERGALSRDVRFQKGGLKRMAGLQRRAEAIGQSWDLEQSPELGAMKRIAPIRERVGKVVGFTTGGLQGLTSVGGVAAMFGGPAAPLFAVIVPIVQLAIKQLEAQLERRIDAIETRLENERLLADLGDVDRLLRESPAFQEFAARQVGQRAKRNDGLGAGLQFRGSYWGRA